MNADMRRIVDDYLTRLRRSMRGASADVANEAELEIRSHIDDGLAALTQPSVGDLLDVLDRLGPPEDFGRDMALYLMVDRGYRDWSLPHMLRSTLFWGLSTLTGAVVILIFGLLFALAAVVTAAEAFATRLYDLIVYPGIGHVFRFIYSMPGGEALLEFAGRTTSPLWWLLGPAMMVLLVIAIRWFVGQYVQRAEPHVVGAQAAGEAWRTESESRILRLASLGFVLHLLFGFIAGVYALDASPDTWLALDAMRSPLGALSALGLFIFLAAPILGVLRRAR